MLLLINITKKNLKNNNNKNNNLEPNLLKSKNMILIK